jgi:hypothetical protein
MSIDSDVFAVMSGHAPLTALLGSGAAFRMFPSVIAQGEPMPAGAYAIRTDTAQVLDGTVAAYQTRVIVECWAEGIAQAKSVADAVVGAFAAVVVPMQSRDGRFDPEIGLHVETVEFDWWST